MEDTISNEGFERIQARHKTSPEPSAELQFTTALGLLGEIMSYDYWEKFPKSIRERSEAFLDPFDKTGTAPIFEIDRAAQRQAGREEAKAYIAELECKVGEYHEIRAKDGERYAALEEAARKAIDEWGTANRKEMFVCMRNLSKALSDLNEARKG